MKKFGKVLAVVIMAAALSACKSGNNGAGYSSDISGSDLSSGALEQVLPGGDGNSSGTVVLPKNGIAEGKVGDIMRTQYFDFTVNSVTAYGAEHADYVADPDNRILVLNLTIENTGEDINYMMDTDFTLVESDSEDDYYFPVDDESLNGDFLPSEYEMNPGDKITGDLLFEVPGDMTDLGLSFMEYTDEDENTFTVYFQVSAYSDGNSDNYEDDYEGGSGGYQNGNLGDTMSAQQFDFKVKRAVLCDEYNEEVPFDEYRYLVLEMTVQNKDSEEVIMYDSDFIVAWDDPDSYEYPMFMYVNGEELMDGLYELPVSSNTELIMVYEVPEGINKFLVCYEEYLDDSDEENLIAITFVPEQG